MRLGIDSSNYTGELSSEQVAALKDAGVTFAIVGTQKPAIPEQQIAAFEAGGIEVPAVYVFLYWDDKDGGRIDRALSLGKPVWIDCEYRAAGDVFELRARIHAAVIRCGAQLAGLYTGSWWWEPKTANYDGFKDLPLWHADYRPKPADLTLPRPYGGWTKAAIWQWSSDGIATVNVDLNIAEDAPAPPQPNPPPPSLEDVALATASAVHFLRNGIGFESLIPFDRRAIKWLAGQLP